MKKYELLLVLPGTLDDKEVADHSQEVLELVKTGAQDVEINNLGKMRLSYPIKQIRYGYYYTIVFNAEPKDVKILEEKLRLRTDVLRGMITYFNTNITAAKKIAYSTNELGVTTMVEKEPVDEPTREEKKEVDLKDIDQKLNEILDNGLMPGV